MLVGIVPKRSRRLMMPSMVHWGGDGPPGVTVKCQSAPLLLSQTVGEVEGPALLKTQSSCVALAGREMVTNHLPALAPAPAIIWVSVTCVQVLMPQCILTVVALARTRPAGS